MITQDDMPNLRPGALAPLDWDALAAPGDPRHPPRILLLYGSLRPQSYSRGTAEEGARI
ncbi:MAG: arsenical resistance protein ArsH, partial [Shimia sp.]